MPRQIPPGAADAQTPPCDERSDRPGSGISLSYDDRKSAAVTAERLVSTTLQSSDESAGATNRSVSVR